MTVLYVAIAKRDKNKFRIKASYHEGGGDEGEDAETSRERWNATTTELLRNELDEVRNAQ